MIINIQLIENKYYPNNLKSLIPFIIYLKTLKVKLILYILL